MSLPLFDRPADARDSLFINGKWRSGASEEYLDVTNPATGEVLASIAAGQQSDVRDAITAADEAFPVWSESTAYQRAEYLYAAHKLMLERSEDLATLMTLEQGKPLKASRTEVKYAA